MSKHDPKITVENVTPQMASQLLGTQRGNRPLRTNVVHRYAREMIAGKWQLNGEAIKISHSGRLIDGQHRLQAVIESKQTVQMMVVRGVADDSIVTLDTGIGRTYYDMTTIRGDNAPRGVGPIARAWYRYERGSPSTTITPTHQELDLIVACHPSIITSAAFIPRLLTVRQRCVASVQGFVHAYTTEAWDRETADLFMYGLNDGTALTKDDPIYVLRKRLIEQERPRSAQTAEVLALTIKAFNAWTEGRSMQRLVWATGGERPEPFPRFNKEAKPTEAL